MENICITEKEISLVCARCGRERSKEELHLALTEEANAIVLCKECHGTIQSVTGWLESMKNANRKLQAIYVGREKQFIMAICK